MLTFHLCKQGLSHTQFYILLLAIEMECPAKKPLKVLIDICPNYRTHSGLDQAINAINRLVLGYRRFHGVFCFAEIFVVVRSRYNSVKKSFKFHYVVPMTCTYCAYNLLYHSE